MAMQSNSPAASPAPSADGSNGPATPVSPSAVQTLALPPPAETAAAAPGANGNGAAQTKRKPSRRANTAERRATHNAVERARRETLNGRFLDLAALLPNLSQIRRPSKSSIVNSSIAHVHASRRHRLLAARELRLLKLEADALRRELNEWRDRSGLPRVEEPVRGEGFQMVLSGELEVLSAGPIEEEDGDEYGDDGFAAEDYGRNSGAAQIKNDGPFAHNVPSHPSLHLQTILPRPTSNSGPMIVQSPNAVSLENPAMANMYDPPHMQSLYMNNGVMPRHEPESKWGMYGQQPQFTPPHSSQGMTQAYNMMGSVPRQAMYQGQGGHMYGSPVDNDDTSSVGSHGHSPVPGAKRQRSGSMGSVGSNGSYEMPGVMGNTGMARRMGNGAWDEGMPMNGGMPGMGPMSGMGGMGMGMGGRGAQAGMSVGNGGNVYAAMML